ncbi:MAG: metalloregulator ArsR/SmtB family transcription factor [Imperialibacter sp.]
MRLKKFSLQYGNQIFKSFSEEARVRILFLLFNQKELCITDIELSLDFTQTKTSRHLTYLRNAGLVNVRKIDQYVFYSIKEEVSDIVSQIFQFLQKDASLQKDLETFRILYSNRELVKNKMEKRQLTGLR